MLTTVCEDPGVSSDRLTGLDASFLRFERDGTRMHARGPRADSDS